MKPSNTFDPRRSCNYNGPQGYLSICLWQHEFTHSLSSRLKVCRMQVMFRLLALVALLASPLPVRCQVPSSFLQSVGMEAAWRSQLRLPIDGGHIVSVRFWVDKSQVHQYAVVDLGDQQIRISAEQLDRDGNPIGLEEAKRLAATQAARLLGKSDGFQVVEVSVPSIKMVVVTRDGLVQTLDAETGALLWASPCGPSWAPAHPAAVCEKGVVVVHGDRLYLLDWQTGKHRMVKSLRRATANAVIANEDVAFVSDFTGRIAAYGLGVDLRPWNYVMSGRAVGLPVVLPGEELLRDCHRCGACLCLCQFPATGGVDALRIGIPDYR
ncbi:MAG: hypothetical protein KatS3mg111_1438 [Pirellulaceae bacterium]|nr:MAG: hypothetical protein KatS3mg111_1438 [Pirellulaceae bacterium]